VIAAKPDGRWVLLDYRQLDIDPTSLVGRFLQECKADCKPPTLKAIGNIDWRAVAGFSASTAGTLAAILSPSPWKFDTASFANFSNTFDIVNETPIAMESGFLYWYYSIHQPTDATFWSQFIAKLQEIPYDKGRSWLLAVKHREDGLYAATISKEAGGADQLIVSGFAGTAQTVCVRRAKYSSILDDLKTKWINGAPGPYSGGISQEFLQKILVSSDGIELINNLSNPTTSDAGFRISPLLLLGPINPGSCK
jgi:hypothetical protein